MTSKLTLLDLIAGRPVEFPLRHMVLNLVTFLTFAAAGVFCLVDLGFRFSWLEFGVEVSLFALFGLLYLVSRIGRGYRLAVHLASAVGFAFVIANFFANGGAQGSGWIGALLVVVLLAIQHEPFWAWVYGLAVLVLQLLCVVAQGVSSRVGHAVPQPAGPIV